jgi:hypothetical protein
MEKHKWSQEEVDFLRSNVGEYPFESVVRRYNQTALRRGWHKRTWYSIKWKCEHLGLSWVVSNSSIIKLADVRHVFGWSRFFCDQLIKTPKFKHILSPFKEGFWYIERKKLVRLALAYPELFFGISRDNLYLILEDMSAVDSVRNSPFCVKKSLHAVKCLETSEEFDNALVAAKHFNVSHYTIQRSVEQKRTVACLNLTFERIRPASSKIKQQPYNKDDQH